VTGYGFWCRRLFFAYHNTGRAVPSATRPYTPRSFLAQLLRPAHPYNPLGARFDDQMSNGVFQRAGKMLGRVYLDSHDTPVSGDAGPSSVPPRHPSAPTCKGLFLDRLYLANSKGDSCALLSKCRWCDRLPPFATTDRTGAHPGMTMVLWTDHVRLSSDQGRGCGGIGGGKPPPATTTSGPPLCAGGLICPVLTGLLTSDVVRQARFGHIRIKLITLRTTALGGRFVFRQHAIIARSGPPRPSFGHARLPALYVLRHEGSHTD